MSIIRQGESGRLAVLAAVVIAVILGAFVTINELVITSADNPDAEMVLKAEGGTPGTCFDTIYCVELNQEFTLIVEITNRPDIGYVGVGAWVNYGDHLIYNPLTPTSDEIVWPDCEPATALGGPTTNGTKKHIALGCLTGLFAPPVSTYVGNYWELPMTCSAFNSSTLVRLLPVGDEIAGTSGTGFSDSAAAGVVPKVSNLLVVCGTGGDLATDTPTVTDTPTNTDTPTHTPTPTEDPEADTPTPTITPTATATPTVTATPNLAPQMSLGATGNVLCTPSIKPTQCVAEYWPGQEEVGTFSLTVNANVIPMSGYGGFQSKVELEGLTYVPRSSCTDEVVWPDSFADSCEFSESGDPEHSAQSESETPLDESDFVGPLVEIPVYCKGITDDDLTVVLRANPDHENGAAYLDEDGELIGAKQTVASTPHADTIAIKCVLHKPEMSLRAYGPNVVCDGDPSETKETAVEKPAECTVRFPKNDPATDDINETTATSFTIAVDANAIPDAYGGFQMEVYFAGLEYIEGSCLAEVLWRPDNPLAFNCNTPITADGENVRRLDVRASDDGFLPLNPSYHVGQLAEFQVRCDEEHQSAVGLTKFQSAAVPPAVANLTGSTFFKANVEGDGNLRLVGDDLPHIGERILDEDGNTVKDTDETEFQILDLLRITCVSVEPPPPPTASPTVTATLENPPTATFTPCPAECPTHTPTNTPVATDTPTRTETPTITETPTETPTPAPPDFAHDTVPPGGKVSTGPDARPDDPLETSVTLPVGGKVSIIEKLIVQPDPAGFHLIGQQVNISAPAGTAQFPLIIQFLLDESIIPEGVTAANIPLFKGGILVPNCADLSGKASPDPCVAKRVRLTGPAEGDIQLTVYTSTASAWNFGEPTTTGPKPDLGDVNGDGVIDPLDALWVVFQTAGIAEVPWPNVSDVNDDGVIDPLDASLILQFAAGLIDEFPGAPSGIFWSWLGF